MGKKKAAARQQTKLPEAKQTPAGKYFVYVVLVLVIVFFAAIRFRLRTMPLERDEGEYAYAGQLMLQGIPPYKLAYTMKLPGTPTAYAVIMALFGQTPAGIHIGLLLVNSATTLLIYLLARRLSGRLGGVVAAASYAALSTSYWVLGLAAHATHFVVLFAVAGILLLLKAIESGRMWQFFLCGVLFGLAFLMKQQGIAFPVFGGLYLLWGEWRRSQWSRTNWRSLFSKVGCYSAGSYSAGVVLPFALTCLILLAAGVFKNFWFWVFTYAREYASENGFYAGVYRFLWAFPRAVDSSIGVWLIAALGLTALWWYRESRRYAVLIGGLLLFSFLAVCPGFYFRPHYFILMLPVVAILAGMAVHSVTDVLARRSSMALAAIPVVVFSAAFAYAVIGQWDVLFEMDPVAVCQHVYGAMLFPEALPIARYLDAHTAPDEPVMVLGSEPEIYFYAKRHSATGFIYMYGLLEHQQYSFEMQNKMIGEVKAAQPQYLVMVKEWSSWGSTGGSQEDLSMTSWIDSFLGGYELVGIAERVGDHTEYRWDNDAKRYIPHGQDIAGVFKRKG
jgi:4-amino-4-deoxy-L-arabinose transferase-like glycosyltransferase